VILHIAFLGAGVTLFGSFVQEQGFCSSREAFKHRGELKAGAGNVGIQTRKVWVV